MAVSNVILCGICDAQHVSNVANYWCPECEEGLCSPCKSYHSVSKASRKHGIISMDDYKKLPAEICNIEQNCTEHDRKFQMFCPRHDQLCCLICISENHKECTGMYPIDEAIKVSKSSTLFDSLEKSLKNIQENFERVVKDREANLSVLKQQHLKSLNDIKDTRRRINSRLDELEKHMIDNLNSTEERLKAQIDTLLKKLSEKLKMIEILKTNLMVVKQYGSNLQAFIGSKMLEKCVTKELNDQQNISDDEGFGQLGLKCQIDEKIIDILTKVISFGSVTPENSPTLIVFDIELEKQAQIFKSVPLCSRSIDDISASLIRDFEVPKAEHNCCITGSSLFPDGRVIFADCHRNKRLVIIQSDGTLATEIRLSPISPRDVTCINDTKVAVTTYANTIHIVDTETKQIDDIIRTSGSCRGITYREGQIIYCEIKKGIVSVQLPTKKAITFVKDDQLISDWSYIASAKENIYYSDNDGVKCYDTRGEQIWTYKNKLILPIATGITIDNFGIVYVISKSSESIVSISSDGKRGKTILTKQNGVRNSFAITWHTNKLYCVSYLGEVIQFKIE